VFAADRNNCQKYTVTEWPKEVLQTVTTMLWTVRVTRVLKVSLLRTSRLLRKLLFVRRLAWFSQLLHHSGLLWWSSNSFLLHKKCSPPCSQKPEVTLRPEPNQTYLNILTSYNINIHFNIRIPFHQSLGLTTRLFLWEKKIKISINKPGQFLILFKFKYVLWDRNRKPTE
jgi:hypothetical protein